MAFWDLLKLPETRDIKNLDDPATTLLHAKILRSKALLKKLYSDFYRQFRKVVEQPENKMLVELGSGGGFIKEIIPNTITSDVLDIEGVDKVFSATDMPFGSCSVDAFFMFDVLHHIAEPRRFFSEANRCLKPGGRIVMIEPTNTLWARFVFKNYHHELFDPQGGWGFEQQSPLTTANGAMPWIILIRDRTIFEQEYPGLRIVSIRNHTTLVYLFSGGFTMRQLLPRFLYPVIRAIEYFLSPFKNQLGMFMTIVIEKAQEGKTAT
ncbi:MAG: class I SAM-dependent methyltransferase [Sedimentisphaerales bacterium]